jgi:Arc/MetJ family transcription regulator
MNTNTAIDENLIAAALQATGLKTKREAIELGLRTLVQLHQQAKLRQLRGKLIWQGDLDALRTDR